MILKVESTTAHALRIPNTTNNVLRLLCFSTFFHCMCEF